LRFAALTQQAHADGVAEALNATGVLFCVLQSPVPWLSRFRKATLVSSLR